MTTTSKQIEPMAKLILERMETTPDEPNCSVQVAYFDGTPTEDQLEYVAFHAVGGSDSHGGEKERLDDEVSKRAGLERWILWPA